MPGITQSHLVPTEKNRRRGRQSIRANLGAKFKQRVDQARGTQRFRAGDSVQSGRENSCTGSGDNTILFWDAETGKQLAPPLTSQRSPVITLAFTPDGTTLASGSEDKSIVLWDVATKQQFGPRLVRHVDKVRALSFSKDGKTLYSASSPGDTVAWDLDPASLPAHCRDRANRNLTEQEWEVYIWPRTVS